MQIFGPAVATLLSEIPSDRSAFSALASAVRARRKAQAVLHGRKVRALLDLPAYRAHAAALSRPDGLFFASTRHYLIQGLSLGERIEAATTHYGVESHDWQGDYLERVSRPNGFPLWAREAGGVCYEIRLSLAHDVPHEGGLSVVLFVNGNRTTVLSLSHAAPRLIGAGNALPPGPAAARPLPFVSRVHHPSDHSWQTAFHKAFHRATAAHLCFAAIEGLATARGLGHVAGIAPAIHPSASPELAGQFGRAYADFWEGLGGVPVSDRASLIPIPGRRRTVPAEPPSAAHRKRTAARRAVADEVRASAAASLAPFLALPGAQVGPAGA